MDFRARCTCGAEAAVAPGSFGRPYACGTCRSRRVAVWGIDPKSKKAVPVTFEASPESPHGFKIPLGLFELPCPCGQRLFARPREVGKRVQCPVCATWLKVERTRDPQTLETRIRVLKSRLNQLPEVPPDPGSSAQDVLCSCGESLRVEISAARNPAHCPACGADLRSAVTEAPRVPGDPPKTSEVRGIDEELSLEDFT